MARVSKYKPEIIAASLLIVYTIIRTFIVAQGISPVSSVSWQVFLIIEVATTPTYVWGVGHVLRTSNHPAPKYRHLAYAVAGLSFVAPYGYLIYENALSTSQGLYCVIGLVLLVVIPRGYTFLVKTYKTRRTRAS